MKKLSAGYDPDIQFTPDDVIKRFSSMSKQQVLRNLVVSIANDARFYACAQNGFKPVFSKDIAKRMVTKPDPANISKMLSGVIIPRATTLLDWIAACNCHIEIIPDKSID